MSRSNILNSTSLGWLAIRYLTFVCSPLISLSNYPFKTQSGKLGLSVLLYIAFLCSWHAVTQADTDNTQAIHRRYTGGTQAIGTKKNTERGTHSFVRRSFRSGFLRFLDSILPSNRNVLLSPACLKFLKWISGCAAQSTFFSKITFI